MKGGVDMHGQGQAAVEVQCMVSAAPSQCSEHSSNKVHAVCQAPYLTALMQGKPRNMIVSHPCSGPARLTQAKLALRLPMLFTLNVHLPLSVVPLLQHPTSMTTAPHYQCTASQLLACMLYTFTVSAMLTAPGSSVL